jgi:hypothetical protein
VPVQLQLYDVKSAGENAGECRAVKAMLTGAKRMTFLMQWLTEAFECRLFTGIRG